MDIGWAHAEPNKLTRTGEAFPQRREDASALLQFQQHPRVVRDLSEALVVGVSD